MTIGKEVWRKGLKLVVVNIDDPDLAQLTFLGEEGAIREIRKDKLDYYYSDSYTRMPGMGSPPIHMETDRESFWVYPEEVLPLSTNTPTVTLPTLI